MAEPKRKKQDRTTTSVRVDSAVLMAVRDELNDLVELLRCLPELNTLSRFLRAHEFGRTAIEHDPIAAVAREHFGRELEAVDEPDTDDLIGAPEAIADAVRWRLERLRAVMEMV
jgi:hypothetical protein